MNTQTKTKATVQAANHAIRKAAEKAKHRHVTVPEMRVGQMFCQGDVGILAVRTLPKGATKIDRPPNGQVAPGNTKGSRHCIDGSEAVTYYRFPGDPLSDMGIESAETWTLRHPEHGHATFGPGRYQLIHQQNEQRQRVLD